MVERFFAPVTTFSPQVVLFVQNQQSQAVKKELVTSVEKLVNDGDTVKEILQHVKEQQEKLQVCVR